MKLLEIVRLLWLALVAWWNDNALRLGASVAYYTLFAIAPILLVAIAVAGSLFGAEAVRGEIVGQIDQLVGTEGGKAVQALLQGATRKEREHPRGDDWRHHLRAGGVRRVSGAAGRTGRHLARQAGARRGPAEGILSRSAPVVWARGGDWLPAAGVAGRQRRAGGVRDLARDVGAGHARHPLRAELPPVGCGHGDPVRAAVQVPPGCRAEVARCRDRAQP